VAPDVRAEIKHASVEQECSVATIMCPCAAQCSIQGNRQRTASRGYEKASCARTPTPSHSLSTPPALRSAARKDYTVGPFGGGLPKTLAVGEQFSFYFIPDHESLASDD
jgi:hypothetical protein